MLLKSTAKNFKSIGQEDDVHVDFKNQKFQKTLCIELNQNERSGAMDDQILIASSIMLRST